MLGPDHCAVIREGTLVAAAKIGEELRFHRLLALAEEQRLVIIDEAMLVDAARISAMDSILEACKLLHGHTAVSFYGCYSVRQGVNRFDER